MGAPTAVTMHNEKFKGLYISPSMRLCSLRITYQPKMKLPSTLITAADAQDTVSTAAKARRIALDLTQADLAARSGVPIATLKRFEQRGEASVTTILALAEVLGALAEFQTLFPMPDIRSLEDLGRQEKPRQRVRRPKSPQP